MVSIRGYQPGDDQQIVKLLDEVFNGWPKLDLQCSSLDYWRWKFIDNPLKVKIIALALNDDQIIGCFHILPQMLKLGDNIHLIGNEVDVGVHPDFRGQGIYNKFLPLREELTREFDMKISYGIGGNPILIKHVQRARERQTFPFVLEKMVRIRNIDFHLNNFPGAREREKYGFYVLKSRNWFRIGRRGSDKISPDFKISEVKYFDDKIDVFWNQIKDHYGFIIVRDKDYLNWRYCDPRGGNYVVKIAESNNQILGFSVLKIGKSNLNYPIGYIVDLLALPDQLNVIKKLTSDAVNYFDNNNVNCIMANALKNSSYESVLYKEDFINNVSNPPFITYRSYLDNNEIDILNKYEVDNMHYTYGDYDHV